ncbi:DEAD/DEAH box helicase [Pontixanthobacter aestiaquae]|uniref:DEAD/DEAH box helicase n=1 Tax=Pontixanthobacter aestiaquae TaxID=1509367 RepID=A0A844Z3Z5_9SPHN|nr:DEAD/DEAH box helicase [Pontixanthobacter aestiaquae]MDN3647026.1 DEAD/DEAH box helicase [Pontixanthobacter aestiaquae]MXO81996.1 DEAD/DEAH box helicase [Pontixanthobacter aestiaquae]
MSFTDLPPILGDALTERGYEKPTAVQAAVIEQEAAGRDLIVSAQTGSGKTVAFGLAMAEQMLGDSGAVPYGIQPLAMVIAPTRELALQVSRELGWLYSKAGARIATCVGGMDASKERRSLRGGAQIVVGTPGRLRDHLERGALDLSALKTVVLDEADEMLDMGFREELEAILDGTPEGRRTLLFSATMPKSIVSLAKRYQNNALRISTVGDDRGHGDISYQAVTIPPSEIESTVVNLLRFHEAETAILFCATRDAVRRLHATLQERGFGVVALSGEHSQQERNQAMQALRDRRARVCVATDVAARGIDLPSVTLVIHVEVPRDAEALQHRSGRTGRAGKKGTAVILVPYPRRRRVESMLRNAKIKADWVGAPTPEAIRAQDRERLMEVLLAPVEADEEDLALGRKLLETRSAEDIAAALVQSHRAKMPQPEELIANTPEARQEAQQERHRPGFENTVWFRMDIGRRHNADPRWVLPLLCRRGHITRNEVGAIRIGGDETFFQVPANIADKFEDAVKRTAENDDKDRPVHIERSEGGPREQARHNARPKKGGPRTGPNNRQGKKPYRKGKHESDGQKRYDGPQSDRGPKRDGDDGKVRAGKWDRDKSGKPGGKEPVKQRGPRVERSKVKFKGKSGYPKGKPKQAD